MVCHNYNSTKYQKRQSTSHSLLTMYIYVGVFHCSTANYVIDRPILKPVAVSMSPLFLLWQFSVRHKKSSGSALSLYNRTLPVLSILNVVSTALFNRSGYKKNTQRYLHLIESISRKDNVSNLGYILYIQIG